MSAETLLHKLAEPQPNDTRAYVDYARVPLLIGLQRVDSDGPAASGDVSGG